MYVALFTSCMVLGLAAMTMPNMDGIPWYLNFGGFGLLSFGFIFMLRWMMTKFEAALAQISDRQTSHSKSLQLHGALIIGLQKQLLAHDLTVHGINPSTGADADERAAGALKKYEECQKSLTDVQRLLTVPVSDPRNPIYAS